MKRNMKILAASLLLAFAPLAGAQVAADIDTEVSVLDRVGSNRGSVLVASKIAGNFSTLAGSEENALALVNALRTGQTVELSYAPTGTETAPTISTIDPPTGHMGWGNVKISLALAQDQLARLGITNPTPDQLQAALNGGDVIVTNADGTTTTTTLRGVLQMRADGMGWGNIAKAGGTKLGPVVSQLKMANTKVAALPPATGEATATTMKTRGIRTGDAKATTVKTRGVTTAAGTPASGKSKGLTTAEGASASGKSRGITTASGTPASGKSKGLTTAAGGSDLSGSRNGTRGLTTAGGVASPNSSRGITTAQGAVTSTHGNGHGRGLVTAGGGNPTHAAAHGGGRSAGAGAGVVTASGGGASGMTTARGNAGGNGKGQGGGKGNGPGGG
jgi:hypothetical protein